MTQILDALPPDFPSKILCGYFNQTRQVQIVRIVNIPNWYFERVVFPRQHLLFEACSEAQLEIDTGAMSHGILLDTIGCDRLYIQKEFILCPVEYSHLGGDKAEGRRQRAEGKDQGGNEEGYYGYFGEHDIIRSPNQDLKKLPVFHPSSHRTFN